VEEISVVCENIYNGGATTLNDVIFCNVGTLFGLDWLLFALFLLGATAVFCYWFKIPAKVGLVIGFALVYAVDLMSGGTGLLRILMVLLGLGIGFIIIKGVLGLMADHSS
jgi:hypothetical protein